MLVGAGPSLTGCGRAPASARRACAAAPSCSAMRPDLESLDLHGNVDTRVGRVDGALTRRVVLALAGLRRPGREDELVFLTLPRPPDPGRGTGGAGR